MSATQVHEGLRVGYRRGLNTTNIAWSHVPDIAAISYASNIPQNVGNYLGLGVFVLV